MADVVDVLQFNASMIETELDRLERKAAMMFLPGKSLFFGRSDELTILDQRGRRIAERG